MSERLRLALPKGELQRDVSDYLQKVGLKFNANPGSRQLIERVKKMPIEVVSLRASDIPRFVMDPDSRVNLGITGSDILWENGMRGQGYELSIANVNPNFQPSALYLGVTKRYQREIRKKFGRPTTSKDFDGQKVATKFPSVAGDVLSGVNANILYVPGSTEGIQYVYDDCNGVLDVSATGETARANDIKTVELIENVSVRLIQPGNLSSRQERWLNDLQEKMYITEQRLKP